MHACRSTTNFPFWCFLIFIHTLIMKTLWNRLMLDTTVLSRALNPHFFCLPKLLPERTQHGGTCHSLSGIHPELGMWLACCCLRAGRLCKFEFSEPRFRNICTLEVGTHDCSCSQGCWRRLWLTCQDGDALVGCTLAQSVSGCSRWALHPTGRWHFPLCDSKHTCSLSYF